MCNVHFRDDINKNIRSHFDLSTPEGKELLKQVRRDIKTLQVVPHEEDF
jgi:hypothetical protein